MIENLGQVADAQGQRRDDVLFTAHGNGLQLFITSTSIRYQFSYYERPEPPISAATGQPLDRREPQDLEAYDAWEKNNTTLHTHQVQVELVGANPSPGVLKQNPTGYYENHYTAHCQVTGAKSYSQVTLQNVYPGIDWVLYRTDKYLKYEFIVHPGADPSQIQLAFVGADKVKLLDNSHLEIGTALGTIEENEPVSWQGSAQTPVESKFVLENDTLRFALGEYDPNKTLTIDPPLTWATYYGGAGLEICNGMTLGPGETIYITGYTESTGAIASPGSHQTTFAGGIYDVYLTKFDSSGNRLWGTYYGGTDLDFAEAVAVDSAGAVYLTGRTRSADPGAIATPGSFQPSFNKEFDAFLVKFTSAGTRLWGTYYGDADGDGAFDIAVDSNADIYIVGNSQSTTGIAVAGSYQDVFGGGPDDGFIAKFDSSGNRLWATYYGGTGIDVIENIVVAASGVIYFSGRTSSPNGISTPGTHQPGWAGDSDAFVAKFTSSGNRLWGSYCGGTDFEEAFAVGVSASEEVYIYGETQSTSSIATPGGHQTSFGGGFDDAFLVSFDSSGTRLWGTYFGGNDEEGAYSVTVDLNGSVFVCGRTESSDFTATPGSHQTTIGGDKDAYVAEFDKSGNLLWSTFFGGIETDEGENVAVAASGAVYISGNARSTSNIATPGSYQPVYGGDFRDSFLAKFFECLPTDTTLTDTACASYTLNGSTYTASGIYTQTLVNAAGCDSTLTLELTLSSGTNGVWTGAADGDWTNCLNWDDGQIPGPTTNVLIDDANTVNPLDIGTMPASTTVNDFTLNTADPAKNPINPGNTPRELQVDGTLNLVNGYFQISAPPFTNANITANGFVFVSSGNANDVQYTNGFIYGRLFQISTGNTGIYNFPIGNPTEGLNLAQLDFLAPSDHLFIGGAFRDDLTPVIPPAIANSTECGQDGYSTVLGNYLWRLDATNPGGSTPYNVILHPSSSFPGDYTPNSGDRAATIMKSDFSATPGGHNWALAGSCAPGLSSSNLNGPNPIVTRTGLTSFSDFTVILDADDPFPVEWLEFSAERRSATEVALSWATAAEQNNEGFYVERSFDGESFEEIDFVAGGGTTTQAVHYNLLDNQATPDRLYYRLRQRDFDGRVSYSNVLEVAPLSGSTPGDFSLQLYPNPFRNSLQLHTDLPPGTATQLELYSVAGKRLFRVEGEAEAVAHALEQKSRALAAGVYLLQVEARSHRKHLKIVKQ